jgi:hypothetical protein
MNTHQLGLGDNFLRFSTGIQSSWSLEWLFAQQKVQPSHVQHVFVIHKSSRGTLVPALWVGMLFKVYWLFVHSHSTRSASCLPAHPSCKPQLSSFFFSINTCRSVENPFLRSSTAESVTSGTPLALLSWCRDSSRSSCIQTIATGAPPPRYLTSLCDSVLVAPSPFSDTTECLLC